MKLSDLQFGDQILQLLCRVEGDSQRRDLRLKGLCEINLSNVLSDSKRVGSRSDHELSVIDQFPVVT